MNKLKKTLDLIVIINFLVQSQSFQLNPSFILTPLFRDAAKGKHFHFNNFKCPAETNKDDIYFTFSTSDSPCFEYFETNAFFHDTIFKYVLVYGMPIWIIIVNNIIGPLMVR